MEGPHVEEGSVGENHSRPRLKAKKGWRRSIEESSNACKKGIRLDLIPTKDPRKGNELYLKSPSNRIAASGIRSWKTYEVGQRAKDRA
nr:hypothetical protein CFP56_14299 [Quercus suber]